jgi:hypothetical protein
MATPPAAGGAATEERSDDDPIPMVARPGDPEALLQVVNRFCLHTAAETVIN